MSRVMKTGVAFVFVLGLVGAAPSARADDDDCRSSCAEADLESLRARLDWTGNDWRLSIRYEVELEDVHPRDGFDMVFTPLDCGRELIDASGEVVQLIASLQYDASCDDDDIELEDEISMRLPEELVGDPFKLRVAGEIVCRGTGKVLDDKTTSGKVCSLPPHLEAPVVVYEEPVVVAPPPPPAIIYQPPPPPPVMIYRPPPPVVIYRPYVHYRPYYECRPRWRRGFVHVDVDW